jgi:hypothetical protein
MRPVERRDRNPRTGMRTADGAQRWQDCGGVRGEAMLRRRETTVGPVALDGRTITLVARTTAVHVGNTRAAGPGVLHLRARPAHVEVLDGDGHRQVIPVRDVEHILVTAITIVGLAGACALRVNRNRRSS